MRDERGAVTAFVATFTVALLAMAGLVSDGGLVLAARRQAINEAEAAARAGAQAIDLGALRSGEPVRLDPERARNLALDHLEGTGHLGTVSVAGDVVRVRVRFERRPAILGAFGLGPVTVTGEGEARAVRGVVTGGD